jgi:hypothetical protein
MLGQQSRQALRQARTHAAVAGRPPVCVCDGLTAACAACAAAACIARQQPAPATQPRCAIMLLVPHTTRVCCCRAVPQSNVFQDPEIVNAFSGAIAGVLRARTCSSAPAAACILCSAGDVRMLACVQDSVLACTLLACGHAPTPLSHQVPVATAAACRPTRRRPDGHVCVPPGRAQDAAAGAAHCQHAAGRHPG